MQKLSDGAMTLGVRSAAFAVVLLAKVVSLVVHQSGMTREGTSVTLTLGFDTNARYDFSRASHACIRVEVRTLSG